MSARRRSTRHLEQVEEIARLDTHFFDSAALWISSILMLSADSGAKPQLHVIGDAPGPDLNGCDCSFLTRSGVGMTSNLAVTGNDAYFAASAGAPMDLVHLDEGGNVERLRPNSLRAPVCTSRA